MPTTKSQTRGRKRVKKSEGTQKVKKESIVSISDYEMMLSLAEALHNSKKINDVTYQKIKKLLREEVKV